MAGRVGPAVLGAALPWGRSFRCQGGCSVERVYNVGFIRSKRKTQKSKQEGPRVTFLEDKSELS